MGSGNYRKAVGRLQIQSSQRRRVGSDRSKNHITRQMKRVLLRRLRLHRFLHRGLPGRRPPDTSNAQPYTNPARSTPPSRSPTPARCISTEPTPRPWSIPTPPRVIGQVIHVFPVRDGSGIETRLEIGKRYYFFLNPGGKTLVRAEPESSETATRTIRRR